MSVYYVGAGGNDGSAGTSWGARKLTLNGVEDIPVVAGDTVYVGPGTYREMLTVDVSGTSGNPITYTGDYTGANTDGVGGVVRITGSDNDQTATRANCITASDKDYRTFTGFTMDLTTGNLIGTSNDPDFWIVEDCLFNGHGNATAVIFGLGNTHNDITVRRCAFVLGNGARDGVEFQSNTVNDNSGHVVENCIFLGGRRAISVSRVGGITVRNCLFFNCETGPYIVFALNTGQTINVNNCLFYGCTTGVRALSTGEITEDYNSFFGNLTDRSNTATGSNSNAYPPVFDTRWFLEATLGNGTLVTPFDLASYSPLVELNSGTGAPSADLRGTTVQGTYREWGPLEYLSTLDIEAGAAGGGGPVIGSRVIQGLGAI